MNLSTLSKDDASLVQHGLKSLGFYEGTTRGLPGPRTEAAYRRYLESRDPSASKDHKGEPVWIRRARSYVGLREIKGAKHNKQILTWWEKIKVPFLDDETPWCAGFVGGVLEAAGYRSTRSAAARSYMNWGQTLKTPKQGAVVVFWRGSRSGWSGHVGFCVGVSANGDPWVLGGNQSDQVNVRKFSKSRLLGYKWPKGGPDANLFPVRRINSKGEYSTNEA